MIFDINYLLFLKRTFLIFLFSAVPVLTSVIVFSTYYGVHETLNAGLVKIIFYYIYLKQIRFQIDYKLIFVFEKVFAALGYLNLLKVPLTFAPIIIAMTVQLKVATNRITDFLQLEEIKK